MSPTLPDPELAPIPERGRRYTGERYVRWGDTDPTGRLRLDALARYLQDVANDDTRDAGFDPLTPWLVRRTTVVVERPAVLGERVALTTFNGGTGSRWADRRTSITGDRGARIECVALWVYVDATSGRPARLTPEFHAVYDEAGGGRQVSARLRHGPPPESASTRDWPLRSTDLDRFDHVNNAATWAAVEDELARVGRVPVVAELEYPDALDAGAPVELRALHEEGTSSLWLVVDGTVRASAVVRTTAAPAAP